MILNKMSLKLNMNVALPAVYQAGKAIYMQGWAAKGQFGKREEIFPKRR